MQDVFRKVAHWTSNKVGSPWAFVIAVLAICGWAINGPIFNYSNTWQLAVNTGTTILTFLMVFLIQNTQNRDARAVHLKLDELIRTVRSARSSFIDAEDMTDGEIAILQDEFKSFRDKKVNEIRAKRKPSTGKNV